MAEPTFTCIRKECINHNDDAYHVETHLCFVCGAEFDPSPELRAQQCPECGWYRCPRCGGCQCSLNEHDRKWIDEVCSVYCHHLESMADIKVSALPETDNPHVKRGLGLQCYFCKRWASIKLERYRETAV